MAKLQVADVQPHEWIHVKNLGFTGLSEWYWRRKAYDGEISSVNTGGTGRGKLLISRAEVNRHMASLTRPARKAGSGGRRTSKQKALASPPPQSEATGADSPEAA